METPKPLLNFTPSLHFSAIEKEEPAPAAPEPTPIPQPAAAPPPPPPMSDPLLEELSRPKVEYKGAEASSRSLEDLLSDIPEAETMGFNFEKEAEEGEEEPEKKRSSGSMVNLVVKNADWLISSLSGWLNERPRSNFQADKEGQELIHEAVSNYSTELSIEFNPKAQLMYSFALVYGGGIITGIFNKGKKAVSWFLNRKTKRQDIKPEIEEAEILHETPRPAAPKTAPSVRYCQLPGCKNELSPSQRSFCSIAHSAKDPNKKRGRKPKDD